MKRWLLVTTLTSILFISACKNNEDASQVSDKSQQKVSEQISSKTSFVNLDEYERYGLVTTTGMNYSTNELETFSKSKERKDYVSVVKDFVENQLKSQISYLDTVDGTYNPRRVTVGTASGSVYALTLNKWHNYGDIWTVGTYSQYNQEDGQGAQPKLRTVDYEMLDISTINDSSVKEWANKIINKHQRNEEFRTQDGKVYVLITAIKGESVELNDIYGDETQIGISYANSMDDQNKTYGEKPYVMIKVNSPITEVVINKYSSMLKEHPSLYMP